MKEARLELRLTQHEKAELQALAAARGTSVSELVRGRILGVVSVDGPPDVERRIRQLQNQGLTSLAAKRVAELEAS